MDMEKGKGATESGFCLAKLRQARTRVTTTEIRVEESANTKCKGWGEGMQSSKQKVTGSCVYLRVI